MSDKPTLEELRENARTNYGITNADDLDAATLQAEIDTIDSQAKDAEAEAKAESDSPASDVVSPDEVDEEDEEATHDFTETDSRADLEAEATRLGIENASDKTEYPNRGTLVAAIDEANADADPEDDEDDEEDEDQE